MVDSPASGGGARSSSSMRLDGGEGLSLKMVGYVLSQTTGVKSVTVNDTGTGSKHV